jgi:hypothetical protein
LRPGVSGVSDRIRVTSIVGRFLEHSRAWMFENGGTPEYYLGSSDWMPRNFDRRVEAVVPIEDPALHAPMRRFLQTSLADNRQAWELRGDGSYEKRVARDGREISAQVTFMADSWGLPLAEVPVAIERVAGTADVGLVGLVPVAPVRDAPIGRDDLHRHPRDARQEVALPARAPELEP